MAALSIRPIVPDEWEAYVRLDAYAFGYDPAETQERYRQYCKPEWTLAGFADGRLVTHLVSYPWQMAINGARVPLAGIADVACWPEDRRAGYTGELLRASNAFMRDQGAALGMLNPTFYGLYQRFGWAQAAETRNATFKPGALSLRPSVPVAAGGAERVDGEPDAVLAPIYDAWLGRANGAIGRDADHWRLRVLHVRSGLPLQAVIWRDTAGQPAGYVLHTYPRHVPGQNPPIDQGFSVRELVALTGDAYRGLVTYVLRHDLMHEVRWTMPPDDPLAAVLTDPIGIKIDTWPGFMLRIVDLVAALEGRGYLTGAPARLVLGVKDATAPWNTGVWSLEVEGGLARVKPAAGEPDLRLEISTLAALYNGFLAPEQAARVGLLVYSNFEALDIARRVFAVSTPPYSLDPF